MDTQSILDTTIQAALDIKALGLVEINMEGKSPLTDFLVICHGTSTAHTQGIADKIASNLKKRKVLPLGTEGDEQGEWILLDYNSVVVHIFLEEVRELYRLEELHQEFPIRKIE
ncbi:MAG: ribosome silencing factor [Proteobacteria bacterium]|nr:ribosome silencing factor [Pseudomonadota bacterium]